MKRHNLLTAAITSALLCSGTAARAEIVSFSGSMIGLGVGGPDASCDPLPFSSSIAPETTTGQSSLGDFTYGHNICLGGIDAPSNGSFLIDFGTNTIFGTLDGYAYATDIPGIGNPFWTYTILGGTGEFLNASGTFLGTGFTDGRTRPTQVSLAFAGDINVPGVPEPATWLLMIVGFAGVGAAMRRPRGQMVVHFA